jgi:hypothetical protein
MDTHPSNTRSTFEFDVAQFKQLYQTFDNQTVRKLPKLYSPSIVFKDPIHELKGLELLSVYYANFCKPETHCQFEFINEIVASDQAFFQWKMHYSHPKINAGKQLTLNGGTLIKFNSHIIYHQDFYDMGAMIYQHLPVLGWVIKKINEHMKEQ